MALFIGAVLAFLPTQMALDNNNNGEYMNLETGQYTADLFWLYGISALFIAVPAFLIIILIGHLMRSPD